MIRLTTPWLLVLTALVFALTLLYGALLDRSDFVTDDGGITLRYAERIAQGKGFNYNDGEAVNGSSNPLYTLVLALFLRCGLTPEMAIVSIAVPALAATAALLFLTFARWWSLLAALACVPTYLAAEIVLDYQFDALEPTFTVLFAALLFCALHTRSVALQGIALGLLVANKLDGALAPIAFAAVWIVARRQLPWRHAFVALAAAAPVFLVLLVSFGSILPNSMLTKLGLSSPGGFHPTWMLDNLRIGVPEAFFPAILGALLPVPAARLLPVRVTQVWLVLVVAAYSLIDLGDPYPWYCVAPAFLLVLVATTAVHGAFHGTRLVDATDAADPIEPRPRAARTLRALGLGVLVVYGAYLPAPRILDRLRRDDGRDRVQEPYAAEISRAATGAWLRKYTDGTEVVWSHFGLPSFEYKGPVFDGSLLNSNHDDSALARSPYLILGPYAWGDDPPPNADDKVLVGVFRYGDRARGYAVYAREDSQIVRAGRSHFLFEFKPSRIGEAAQDGDGAPDSRLVGSSLYQRVPSSQTWEFEATGRPIVCFKPELPQEVPPDAMPLAWTVLFDGEVVAEGVIRVRGATRRVRVQAPRAIPSRVHRLEFRVQSAGPGGPVRHLTWTGLSGAPEAPVTSEDFHAMCAPWARLVDAVEQGP